MTDDVKPVIPADAEPPPRPPTGWEKFLGKSGVAVSLYMQLGAIAMAADSFSYAGGRDARPALAFVYLLTTALVCTALAPRLRDKGYSWTWSLLGFLSLFGWMMVQWLPRREQPRGFAVMPADPPEGNRP